MQSDKGSFYRLLSVSLLSDFSFPCVWLWKNLGLYNYSFLFPSGRISPTVFFLIRFQWLIPFILVYLPLQQWLSVIVTQRGGVSSHIHVSAAGASPVVGGLLCHVAKQITQSSEGKKIKIFQFSGFDISHNNHLCTWIAIDLASCLSRSVQNVNKPDHSNH